MAWQRLRTSASVTTPCFHFCPGSPARRLSVTRASKASFLAQLHRDLASWDAPGQRDGFGRAWELDLYVAANCDYASLNDLLSVFGQEHPEIARAIRSQKYAMLRELSTLGYGELPAVPCHFDFHHDNLLFQRGTLSGLLDFDLAHLDARVADVASSIFLDCFAPPAYSEISPTLAAQFVAGYVEHAPLSDAELQLIVPLIRAAILGLVVWRLAGWARGEDREIALHSLRRSVTDRLPSFARGRNAARGRRASGRRTLTSTAHHPPRRLLSCRAMLIELPPGKPRRLPCALSGRVGIARMRRRTLRWRDGPGSGRMMRATRASLLPSSTSTFSPATTRRQQPEKLWTPSMRKPVFVTSQDWPPLLDAVFGDKLLGRRRASSSIAPTVWDRECLRGFIDALPPDFVLKRIELQDVAAFTELADSLTTTSRPTRTSSRAALATGSSIKDASSPAARPSQSAVTAWSSRSRPTPSSASAT